MVLWQSDFFGASVPISGNKVSIAAAVTASIRGMGHRISWLHISVAGCAFPRRDQGSDFSVKLDDFSVKLDQ
jgi:hypothetical protein